jgi:O-antigen ligase
LGAVVVGGMLFWNRKGKGMLLVGAIAVVVAMGIIKYGSTKVFDERMRQTVEGNKSDQYRKDILWACLNIGFENPLIGVSPQKLPIEIGRRTSNIYHYGYVESHNVYAHLFAGSGMLSLLSLFAVGVAMWRWRPKESPVGGPDDPARDARRLLRMVVFLWFVRSMFTREILYNPSFNIALGLAIGLCIIAEAARPIAPAKRLVRV